MTRGRHEDLGRESKGVGLSGGVEGGEEGVISSHGELDGLSVIDPGHEVIESSWRRAAGVAGQARRVNRVQRRRGTLCRGATKRCSVKESTISWPWCATFIRRALQKKVLPCTCLLG